MRRPPGRPGGGGRQRTRLTARVFIDFHVYSMQNGTSTSPELLTGAWRYRVGRDDRKGAWDLAVASIPELAGCLHLAPIPVNPNLKRSQGIDKGPAEFRELVQGGCLDTAGV